MEIKSQKLNSVAINEIAIQNLVVVEKPNQINHIFCCDISGSMSSDLARMRTQLKNRIPDLVGLNNTITIIAFSGRNQATILKEGVLIDNVVDLKNLNDSIDKFLRPLGATSFKEPLQLTSEVIGRLVKLYPESVTSFSFLTDGYNNSCSWSEVLTALSKLEGKVGAATFFEYGYYADSDRLSEMAEVLGGQKVFAKDFETYDAEFISLMKTGNSTTKRYSFDISTIKSKMQFAFLFTITAEGIIVYGCAGKNEVLIPENTDKLYFFSEYSPSEFEKAIFADSIIYASAYVLADKLKYKLVDGLLSFIGDENLQDVYANSYGKQKLNEFKEITKKMVTDSSLRYQKGKNPGKAPKANAYCVMNLIDDLMQDDENQFYPYHEDFNYNRIGAKRQAKTELSEEVQEKLSKAKSLSELEAITASIEPAEFIYPKNQADQGQSFEKLVWNESRANLSINTKLFGSVKLPTNNFGIKEVPSFIYRSYTFIKDGILNVTELPVTLSQTTLDKLKKQNITFTTLPDGKLLMDISKLPIINRKMVSAISAKELAKFEYELMIVQNRQKYLKVKNEEYNPKVNTETANKYSPEFAEYLKSIGVSDFNGFSPKTEAAEPSGDTYMSTNLEIKIKSYSNIPSVAAVEKKVNEGKSLTPSEEMFYNEIQKIDAELAKFKKDEDKAKWLKENTKAADIKRRTLLSEIAQQVFSVILSRTWFTEFKEDFAQNQLAYTAGGLNLHYTFDYNDKEVKL